MYSIPSHTTTSLLSKLNFSSIINGTTKTLNLVNQAIPIVKQVSPVLKNAKTMFNIMNEFKKNEPINPTSKTTNTSLENSTTNYQSTNFPTFFI